MRRHARDRPPYGLVFATRAPALGHIAGPWIDLDRATVRTRPDEWDGFVSRTWTVARQAAVLALGLALTGVLVAFVLAYGWQDWHWGRRGGLVKLALYGLVLAAAALVTMLAARDQHVRVRGRDIDVRFGASHRRIPLAAVRSVERGHEEDSPRRRARIRLGRGASGPHPAYYLRLRLADGRPVELATARNERDLDALEDFIESRLRLPPGPAAPGAAATRSPIYRRVLGR